VVSGKDSFTKMSDQRNLWIWCWLGVPGRRGILNWKNGGIAALPTRQASGSGRHQSSGQIWTLEDGSVHLATRNSSRQGTRTCLARVYALIIGQYSQALHNHMEANDKWNNINKGSNMIGVLELIQNCMTQCQMCQKPVHTSIDAEAQVYAFHQCALTNNE
jgi:hypothetical protein